MPKECFIQILDGVSDQIVYFDRMKTYRSTHRVITSYVPVNHYSTRQDAETDAELVGRYYHGQHLTEVVEHDFAEGDNDECAF